MDHLHLHRDGDRQGDAVAAEAAAAGNDARERDAGDPAGPDGNVRYDAPSVDEAPDADARETKIREHQIASLNIFDTLRANIGAMNGDAMRLAGWLQQSLEPLMSDGPLPLDQFAQAEPVLKALLRVFKQVDRFSEFELRARKTDQLPQATLRDLLSRTEIDWGSHKANISRSDTHCDSGGESDPIKM